DAAAYSVAVSNVFGVITSSVANLIVLDPVISTQPTPQSVNPGQFATFSAAATGTPPIGFQWIRDGVNIDGATNASVTLTNAQAADAGSRWQVVASNAFGFATSAVAVLTVNLAQADSLNP